MAEWLKALVSKTGIPFTGYRGFESPFFRWISAPSVMIIKHLGLFLCKKVAPKMHRGLILTHLIVPSGYRKRPINPNLSVKSIHCIQYEFFIFAIIRI